MFLLLLRRHLTSVSNKLFEPEAYRRYSKGVSNNWIKPEGVDTGIKVYNCTAKAKVPLILRSQKFLTWYTCGPTVYDSSHIGHASCYVKLDIIQRILRDYFNIPLITAMNITDIDDKIIRCSKEQKVHPTELAKQYEKEFWENMQSLNVIKPDIVLHVTTNMELIKNFIHKLKQVNMAHKVEGRGMYFSLTSYTGHYAKLQEISPPECENGETGRADFALWKEAKDGEPAWDSEWGPGRPGWHTECSTLASALFGAEVDIHAGGIDLRFPHHENEEAQCCAYHSKSQWVNYWLHTGHLHLSDDIKMSKSLKNTVTISEMLKSCSCDTFRLMCVMSHYSYNMEYSENYVRTADKVLKNVKHFVGNCNDVIGGKVRANIDTDILNGQLKECVDQVQNALADDFDTSRCVKIIIKLITSTNKAVHSAAGDTSNNLQNLLPLVSVLNFVTDMFKLFGISLDGSLHKSTDIKHFDNIVDTFIDFRQTIRVLSIESKNQELLRLCDNVRERLKSCGIVVKDHGKLSSWIK